MGIISLNTVIITAHYHTNHTLPIMAAIACLADFRAYYITINSAVMVIGKAYAAIDLDLDSVKAEPYTLASG